ncbi:MAG TPA: sigma-70 family RNA polymerase sigma factor [Chitinophagales bacterium]|nr:sigma-70 family RNA polymerase sigma factor [Chitinophagales bacterium]HNF69011.1 sigma-70 family RNA polymerase sigma factor [Chitinophagales bacterium]HNJ89061.1 sigma-70 family RNA polymerase sigma factor [Chitinophagales bacterium]HNO29180.1 sigma-70 family RNA polymerase sigma factor [Chitinophagales bacterium]
MGLNDNLSDRAKEDLALVESARRGDQRAYGELMSRYKDTIHYMVLKMVHNRDDAEDLTIEAFGKAFLHLERYTPDFAFSTWLFKIAVNNAIDFIRKKRLHTLSLDDEQDEFTRSAFTNIRTNNPDPEEKFIKEQRANIMRTILDELNPKYKALVEMRYFDELSYEEISETLNIPLGTVKAQLFRARNLLAEILADRRAKM